jgi:hypothetical protein
MLGLPDGITALTPRAHGADVIVGDLAERLEDGDR